MEKHAAHVVLRKIKVDIIIMYLQSRVCACNIFYFIILYNYYYTLISCKFMNNVRNWYNNYTLKIIFFRSLNLVFIINV